jgi:hypothetical protein
MSIAHVSPFPYIILLAIMLVAVAVCFYKFPSLRSIRKPRNLMIYLVILLLLGSVVYQVYDAFLGVSVVTYDVSINDNEFVASRAFELEVVCENLGVRETSFYLTLTSINASLTAGNQQNYIKINNTAIKIPFHFNTASIHVRETKPVLVTIDESVSDFGLDFKSSVITTGGIMGIEGQLNETTNDYAMWAKPGPCV